MVNKIENNNINLDQLIGREDFSSIVEKIIACELSYDIDLINSITNVDVEWLDLKNKTNLNNKVIYDVVGEAILFIDSYDEMDDEIQLEEFKRVSIPIEIHQSKTNGILRVLLSNGLCLSAA